LRGLLRICPGFSNLSRYSFIGVVKALKMCKVKQRLRSGSKKEKQKQRSDGSCSDGSNQSTMISSYASGSHIHSILKSSSENEDCYSSVNRHSERNSFSERSSGSGQSGMTFGTTRSSAAAAVKTAIANNINPNKKKVQRVGWKTVNIREYERALGDNPSCSSGAPITYVYAKIEVPVRTYREGNFVDLINAHSLVCCFSFLFQNRVGPRKGA
jgi:hypothetical protein